MPAFEFLKNNISKKWTILAPRRSKRPDVANGDKPACPFCPEQLEKELELYSVPKSEIRSTLPADALARNASHNDASGTHQALQAGNLETNSNNQNTNVSDFGFGASDLVNQSDWLIKVIPNKFPFADIHELIIHTPEHQLSLAMLPEDHIQQIIEVYKHRYNEHSHSGQVFIFHNHGEKAGESIPHSHTQLAVLPEKVYLDIPLLSSIDKDLPDGLETPHFVISCPQTSQWSDEVWIAPKARGSSFGEIGDLQIADFAHALSSLIRIYDLRYKKDFPFNFYIYPGNDWYLRIIPRNKVLGGLEVGTNVFVNTQSPSETLGFIKAHFLTPEDESIPEADYHHTV